MTPRPALAATIAASLLVLGATGALAAGSPQLNERAPDKTSPTTTPIVAPATTPTAPPPTPHRPPRRRPRRRSPSPTSRDRRRRRRRRRQAVALLRRLPRRRPRRHPVVVGQRVPAPVRRAVHPARGRDLRRLPRAHDADPRLRRPGNTSYQDVVDYGAFYCPDGDFMAYDDGEHGSDLRARRGVRAVDRRRRDGPRVRPRHPGPHRRARPRRRRRSTPNSRPTASPGPGRDGPGTARPGLSFADADIRTGLIALVDGRATRSARACSSPAATARRSTASGRSRRASSAASTRASASSTTRCRLLPNEFDPGGRRRR